MENNYKKMSAGKIIAIVIAVLAAALILFGVGSYNSLIRLKETVNNQSSNIDTQLKRRTDLIPNLLETVKGYAKHETEIMESVAKSREKLAGASNMEEKAQADTELTNALSRLLVVVENYPDLKANTNFLELQQELQDTENKIATARQFYNDTVLTYNNKIEMFPSNIIASIFKFKMEEFFKAEEEARQNVKVEF